jgi:hypothetical protein
VEGARGGQNCTNIMCPDKLTNASECTKLNTDFLNFLGGDTPKPAYWRGKQHTWQRKTRQSKSALLQWHFSTYFCFVEELFALNLISCAPAIVCKHYLLLKQENVWNDLLNQNVYWISLKNEFSHFCMVVNSKLKDGVNIIIIWQRIFYGIRSNKNC